MFIKGNYGKKPEERVKREEWDTPSGAHAISVELVVDSQEAAIAISELVETVKKYKYITNKDELAARTNWACGYLAALATGRLIAPDQADSLQELVNHTSNIAYNNIKNAEKRKRG